MLRISSFLCVALSIFSIAADAATASLIEQLTDLSKRFSTAIIYNTSLLAGLTVEPSTQTTLEQTLDLWLTPRQLSWQKTASGIVIFQTATSVPAPAISIPETNNTQVLEEVTVTESLPTPSNGDAYNHNYQQAINYAQQIKSNYVGQSEIAVGAMLNQLPAENLAEALQAVPGISITRDRGEALNINAMGLGAEYQLTLFNGHRLANTENVRNSNQYGQQHRFDIFSAGLFSNIAVYKTTNSSLPSGAVGATVNLLSDDPLAYQDNNLQVMLTTATLEGEQNLQPSFGLTGNAKTADGNLAVMIKMNYENRLQRQFQFETWHWGENGGAPKPYQWPDINKNILVPTDGLALTIENEDRTRATYYGALAWQATERLKLNTLWFRSDTDFSFDEHRISINPQSQSAQAQVNDENNSLNQFVFNDANAKTSREESNLYYANQTIQVDANWQPSAHLPLTLSPFYSSSKANSKTKEPISRVHGAISPMQADVVLQNRSVDSFNFAGNLGLVSSYSHINQMSKRTINVLNEVDEWGIDSHWSRENYWGLQALDIGFLHSTQNYDYTRKDISL
jgi:TonB-dependent receptor